MFGGMPQRGVVFWPVGTGDSSTIVVTEEIVVQVDLHDMAKADNDDMPEYAVVDRLVEVLPTVDGEPYLAVFVLTHADQDHCRGFADLLDKVRIGELWATPRLWRELDDPDAVLCDDAKAFQEETERRVNAIMKAVADGDAVESGDRVLVIGYDTDHDKHAYHELPDEYLTGPGKSVSRLDGVDVAGSFEAFLHAPFVDDCAAKRNETSVAMQVTLTGENGKTGQTLLFGDLSHDTIMKIFTYSEDNKRSERLKWNVLLAPHHCSKSVMYVVDEDGEEVLAQDVLDAFGRHALDGAIVVSSSCPVPASNTPGQNPPHVKAKDRYSEIADEFICTMEYPTVATPQPVVFGLTNDGFVLVDPVDVEESKSLVEASRSGRRLALVAGAAALVGPAYAYQHRQRDAATVSGPAQVREAIAQARGNTSAPGQVTGFGGR
ncbi:hypothetical protein ACQP1P_35320 [Dactylosporangium sp. CA-052675]|uniref:hypothetical protein n=1 Tax=Dactylosporangium sp. CA-052675 TaxID=3239927 RepID=UPI003D8B4689